MYCSWRYKSVCWEEWPVRAKNVISQNMWFFYSSPISKGERPTPCRLWINYLFIRGLDEYICIYICPNAYTDFSHAQPAHYLGSLLEFQIRKKIHTHEGIQARYRTGISIRGLFWRYYTELVPKSYIQWRAEIAAIDPKDALAEKTARDIYCGKLTRTCIFAEYTECAPRAMPITWFLGEANQRALEKK